VAGSAVEEGEHLLRIVDHSKLWIDARLPESQLALVRVGQKAHADLIGAPERHVEAELVFIHPHIDPETRTGLARLEVANPDMNLRPGMYATVEIEVVIADDALSVPREAVIDSGTRQIVFLAEGNGRFEPREVHIGAMDRAGLVEVRDGLAEGETVVTSGQFLLDAESRMREALAKFLAIRRQGGGDTAAPPAAATPHVH
jgi:RND family efflux transporter MFP subunit